MITWKDLSNANTPEWWSLKVPHLMSADVSRGAAEPWRISIRWTEGWIEGQRDRFDLPPHWDAERVKRETLAFIAPRLAVLAETIATAARDVVELVDAANAAR